MKIAFRQRASFQLSSVWMYVNAFRFDLQEARAKNHNKTLKASYIINKFDRKIFASQFSLCFSICAFEAIILNCNVY